ncbi:MAG TPA: neutral/alkaline non-lysosomal ceramidase N-terminal domain-containing protein [Bryobacteraceae bacterium]|nr:neutral/alkaline non-lysosomal ceramidase N-terminal domain-containing protein [Bryobacteraceae bacterium]
MRSLLALLLLASPGTAAFRASAVKVDITPPGPQWLLGYAARKSTGVHDRIFHRIVAMDDGATQFYLAATDVCLFSPEVYDEVARDLKRETGIDRAHFWWTVTHTHSAPEVGPPGIYKVLLAGRSDHDWDREYTRFIRTSLIEGIKQAKARLEPARLAVGTGLSRANINRRARDVNGQISLGLNPDGPVDRQIGLIRLEKPDGSPVALVANYAMHGTVLGGKYLEISGDGPGVVAAYVEQKLGAPMLYVNGAAGNIAPIYTVAENPRSGHLTEFNVLLGDRILEAHRALAAGTADVKLQAIANVIETPRKSGLGWPAELAEYSRIPSAGTPLVRLPVRFLRLNDTVVWAAPVELFCEIAMKVRSESPFAHTFYFGYANGWLGYLPTAKAFGEGGYEPRTSPFSEQAERDLTEGVTAFLSGLPR